MAQTSIERATAAYLTFCRVEGRTPKTVTWHDTSLKKLTAFLTQRGIADLQDVTTSDLREYVAMLQHSTGRHGQPMSPHSVATYVRSLRAFFRWLHNEEFLDKNPAQRVAEPKTGERDIVILSPQDIRTLAAVCSGTNGDRDRALILLLFDTGLRASEVCNAQLEDLSESPPTVRVLGKGRKWRTVPIGRVAMRAIRRYLNQRRDDSPFLFISQTGRALTANGLLQLLARRGRQTGIDCHPHLFRHTFAVTYLRNGGDLFSLQAILGHTSLDMVRHYGRLADTDVSEKHAHFSPADRLTTRV